MNTEQQQRIREVEAWQNQNHPYALRHHQDIKHIDFLLSIVKGQEPENAVDYERQAHDILSEYNSADNPGLLRQKVAEGFAKAATQMRSACVEKVKELHDEYEQELETATDSEKKLLRAMMNTANDIKSHLESVSIQEQK